MSMKFGLVLASAAIAALAFSPAYAGGNNINKNRNSSNSFSSAGASSSSSSSTSSSSKSSGNTTTFNDRLQAPGLGSFGGGGCPEGLMLSIPGGGIGFQVQCKEFKQSMKYGVVNGAFGRDGTRRWLCESDKSLYTLPQCRAYRIENGRRR